MRRIPLWLVGLLPAVALSGVVSCAASPPTICAGQCAPPYELVVRFAAGTSHATAQEVLTSCARSNPVVIRVGRLHNFEGQSAAFIYTKVFGNLASRLLKCLRSSGVATAGWPT